MLSEQAQLQQVANIAGIRIPAQVGLYYAIKYGSRP